MFNHCYENKRVLVTGHSGFKGSWLTLWLNELGAEVRGVSLPPDTEPNHYTRIRRNPSETEWCDIRNREQLQTIFQDFRPELVFHLAALPLVRASYAAPVETFETNVMGTVHVLEAGRNTPSVRAMVIVTSDKCYENTGKKHPYTEIDPMGGHDPYSASKGCAELAAAAYRRSFFAEDPSAPALATARAGNVIGGGDWAPDRLIPDLIRSAAGNRIEFLRNPEAVRPWQHVLEPLSGYLRLGQLLLSEGKKYAGAWNFGPVPDETLNVAEISAELAAHWNRIRFDAAGRAGEPHEASYLTLDSTRAAEKLQWTPVWNVREALRHTALWYQHFYEENRIDSQSNLREYIRDARNRNLSWTR